MLYQNPVQFFSVIRRGVPLPHSNALQYYVKREKCKVNDVIFPSGCEARTINLGNKNMKIGIFTGGTSVRSNSQPPDHESDRLTTEPPGQYRSISNTTCNWLTRVTTSDWLNHTV